jgi:polyhydroxyalkanoate synthesis regulator phasin
LANALVNDCQAVEFHTDQCFPIKSKNVAQKQLRELLSESDVATEDQMTHLRQSINHYQNRVEAVQSEKLDHKIH